MSSNQKDKLIRLYKEILVDPEASVAFYHFNVCSLGTTTTITRDGKYHGVDRPKLITLEQVKLKRGKVNDREEMALDFKMNAQKHSQETEVKSIPNTVLFGLVTLRKNIKYVYDHKIESAKFSINYGAVKEEISQEEYFDLLDLYKKEDEKRLSIRTKEFEEKLEERREKDQERLDKMD